LEQEFAQVIDPRFLLTEEIHQIPAPKLDAK
jgi:hypothetical protein